MMIVSSKNLFACNENAQVIGIEVGRMKWREIAGLLVKMSIQSVKQ